MARNVAFTHRPTGGKGFQRGSGGDEICELDCLQELEDLEDTTGGCLFADQLHKQAAVVRYKHADILMLGLCSVGLALL